MPNYSGKKAIRLSFTLALSLILLIACQTNEPIQSDNTIEQSQSSAIITENSEPTVETAKESKPEPTLAPTQTWLQRLKTTECASQCFQFCPF